MRGGPIDLTPFGSVLTGLGILYWVVAAALVVLALWWPKRWWVKVAAAVAVLVVFVYPVAVRVEKGQVLHDESRARLDASMALFRERCNGAGEKITRTVDNVDGVVWMKWRPMGLNSQQFALDDPYGKDCSGEECIKALLRVTKGAELNPEEAKQHAVGYRFVETIDPADGQHYRYVGVVKLHPRWTQEAVAREKELTGKALDRWAHSFMVERQAIDKFTARYGVAWEDTSTREDREHWIAGGSLKVTDLQTGEVIAERIGYLIDTGQGSTVGFRDPWGWAKSYGPRCPLIDVHTWEFAARVLQPKRHGE